MSTIGCLGEAQEGAKVHGLAVKTGLGFDPYVCNSLIDMYAELGQVDNFKQVFDEMPERNIVCWNVTILGYVKCRRFGDALNVFRRMRNQSNEKPDEVTVVSTLSACTALENLELGKEIDDYVRGEYVQLEMHWRICMLSVVVWVNLGKFSMKFH